MAAALRCPGVHYEFHLNRAHPFSAADLPRRCRTPPGSCPLRLGLCPGIGKLNAELLRNFHVYDLHTGIHVISY